MKKVIILVLSIFCFLRLNAQSNDTLKKYSFELLVGIGKVAVLENDNNIYALGNSPIFDSEYIANKGFEFDTRLSANWSINEKNQILIGIDLNIWSRKSIISNGDIIATWQESSLPERRISSQVDFILGYRYFLLNNQNRSFFLENVFHKKIHSSKFPGINYSTELGVGGKFKICKNYNFLTVISYKQPLGSSFFNEIFQNKLGVKVGVNKAIY